MMQPQCKGAFSAGLELKNDKHFRHMRKKITSRRMAKNRAPDFSRAKQRPIFEMTLTQQCGHKKWQLCIFSFVAGLLYTLLKSEVLTPVILLLFFLSSSHLKYLLIFRVISTDSASLLYLTPASFCSQYCKIMQHVTR